MTTLSLAARFHSHSSSIHTTSSHLTHTPSPPILTTVIAVAETKVAELAKAKEELEIHQGKLLADLSRESAAAKAHAKRAGELEREAAERQPRLEAAEARVAALELQRAQEAELRAQTDTQKDDEARCARGPPLPLGSRCGSCASPA